MEIEVSRIYVFTNGTRIDLKKVLVIGALDNDYAGNIFIPIYCEGYNKPIQLILGNSIGKVSEERKAVIMQTYSDFTSEWETFKMQKPLE